LAQRPCFQSQRLKVGGSAARWVFVVTAILDSFWVCCPVKVAHYANKPRQESAQDKSSHKPLAGPAASVVGLKVGLWEMKQSLTRIGSRVVAEQNVYPPHPCVRTWRTWRV